MSNTELIKALKQAAKRADYYQTGERELFTRTAVALEAAEVGEDVWEYAYADMAGDPDSAHYHAWGSAPKENARYRRRKAGPWEKVQS